MSEVYINFESIDQAANEIRKVHGQLLNSLDELEAKLRPMVSSWGGEARQAYFEKKKTWDNAAQEMASILQQMGKAVANAHDGYQSAEASNRKQWSK
jgi:6 kDa early secretory antigenic target